MATTDIISRLTAVEGNSFCADCGTRSPRWASVNLGVLLCIKCSGIHRTLGVHLSQVKSLTLDNLKPEWIDSLLNIGNEVANKYYLHKLPQNVPRHYLCNTPVDMEVWIRNKYEKKIYVMDQIEEPFILLAKGLSPRDIIIGTNLGYDNEHADNNTSQRDDKFGLFSKRTRSQPPPVYNNYTPNDFNLFNKTDTSFFNNQDFNPFGIDMTAAASTNTSAQWNGDDCWNYDKMKFDQSTIDYQASIPPHNITDPIELRDAKINAAKHSISRLFHSPSQIGFKGSSYQQTRPNCVTDSTLDFSLSDIKNKLKGRNDDD